MISNVSTTNGTYRYVNFLCLVGNTRYYDTLTIVENKLRILRSESECDFWEVMRFSLMRRTFYSNKLGKW